MRESYQHKGAWGRTFALVLLLVLAGFLLVGGPAVAADEPAAEADKSEADKQAEKEAAKAEKQAEKEAAKAEKKAAKRRQKMEKMRRKQTAMGKYKGATVEGLLDKAQGYLDNKKWGKAQEILLFLEDNEVARDHQERVKLLLANSYFGQGGTLNYVEALSRYRTFLTFFPNSQSADLAQYRIGMCYFKQAPKPNRDQSTTESALFEFMKLLDIFPNSEYAGEAEARIREARDMLAEREYKVAMFYFNWKEWEAAILRLQKILSDFPDFSRKMEVYRNTARAYYKMGARVEGDIYNQKFLEAGGTGSLEGTQPEKGPSAKRADKLEKKAASRAEKAKKKAEAEAEKAAKKAEEAAEKAAKKAEEARRKQEKKEESEGSGDQGEGPDPGSGTDSE